MLRISFGFAARSSSCCTSPDRPKRKKTALPASSPKNRAAITQPSDGPRLPERNHSRAQTMKILVLCYEYPPLGGGGGRMAKSIAEQLARQGHEVRVQTAGMRHLPARETIEGVEV